MDEETPGNGILPLEEGECLKNVAKQRKTANPFAPKSALCWRHALSKLIARM